MKVCITAQGALLESKVENRFGRAPYFIIADTETGSFEAVVNPFADGSGGVGPKAANLIIEHQAGALISGLLGGNAKAVLDMAGVEQFVYQAGGTVSDALDAFKKNTLDRVK
ncbi:MULTISPECIES: NifB/NifX family molybdenum-iron cluster-binding protein [Methanocorpusculum]|jgi:predicted Fe-Mo cluster-binding NifX family protein|uniref:Dinitrogenase iron-molybdenum cofactor biosynthesis protein n=2 Tax=Methanocorpusculum TaxID=2192 RepID=A2SQA9_METLZ|nr:MULTISPECIES: NifB/NifX family molybdenum-iron cluster-binding protein [Methanocorpusculum]ABN06515.1 Dinitrogenase iron-molybdenum cofactor biosynthesis protein [Methanocorpusculum labreanum Z]MDD2248954.1 NifB/NifX family molybdenum-iron cluster-binding protein [Methanocorpusculum sp.]MDD2803425.1 NifB/NifX family molybdenum-iron cluster-binding protein [Methanocorpusculum sp.]MDD3047201.1 NifB/NifX family molybdenum-iron cluster-binding protein [Methanocorpusculum sp.]MDD3912533.1 NifB/N